MIDDYIEKWIIKAVNDLKVAEHELRQPEDEIITDEFYMPTVAEAKECFSIASKDKDFLLKKIS